MGYKILEHTADLRMRVSGRTLEELFRSALLGMMAITKSDLQNLIGESAEAEIKISSPDETVLLIDFLSEALYDVHAKKAVYNGVEFFELKPTKLKAVLRGFKVLKFDKDVKAVTFHEAEIRKNKKGEYETIIIFDI